MTLFETGIIESIEAKVTSKNRKYIRAILNCGRPYGFKFDLKYDVEIFNDHLIESVPKMKGSVVVVVGRPNISAYINKNNEPTYKLRIVATEVNPLSHSGQKQTSADEGDWNEFA